MSASSSQNETLEFDFAPLPKGPDGATPGSMTWTNQWCLFSVSPDPRIGVELDELGQ